MSVQPSFTPTIATLGIGFGLLAFFSGCSTSFRPRTVSNNSLAKIKLNKLIQFLEIPRIGVTGQYAQLIEGQCKTPGQTVEYSVPGTHIGGSTTCLFDSRLSVKYWRATVNFSSVPDGAVVVMAQERRGTLIEELGMLEFKKDTAFCLNPGNNASRATPSHSPDAVASGDSDFDVHLICNATQWNTLAAESRDDPRIRKARILLRNHIDFSGITVNPFHDFEGELVGGGFSLMRATSFRSEDAPTGFFGGGFRGKINSPDSLEWLPHADPWDLYLLVDDTVVQTPETNLHPIGGLIGRMISGTVSNVWGRSILVEGTQYAGGLVGQIDQASNGKTSQLTNVLMERSSIVAMQHHAGGVAGSVGTGSVVQGTKLFLVSASAPNRSGGLAGANAGRITSVLAIAGGATDVTVANPDLPSTRVVNIEHSAGGVVGTNISIGLIEKIVANTHVATTLNSEIPFSGSDVGGIVGTNDGTVSMAFLENAWAGGAINTGCVVGQNRGTISDVATKNCGAITPYSTMAQTYPSVGGFVGRAASGLIARSYIHGVVGPYNVPVSAFPGIGASDMEAILLIHNGFFGALGGSANLPQPVFNGALVLSSKNKSGQSGDLPNGLRVLDAEINSRAWLSSNHYVYVNGEQAVSSWSSDAITTTNLICGKATTGRVWKLLPDQTLDQVPIPFIMDRCP